MHRYDKLLSGLWVSKNSMLQMSQRLKLAATDNLELCTYPSVAFELLGWFTGYSWFPVVSNIHNIRIDLQALLFSYRYKILCSLKLLLHLVLLII